MGASKIRRSRSHSLDNPRVVARNEAGPRYVPRDHAQTSSRREVFVVKGLRRSLRDSRRDLRLAPRAIEGDLEVEGQEALDQSQAGRDELQESLDDQRHRNERLDPDRL